MVQEDSSGSAASSSQTVGHIMLQEDSACSAASIIGGCFGKAALANVLLSCEVLSEPT